MTASALRRLEQWCDPSGRLAASGRPSRGITLRFEDKTRPAATLIGCVDPRGVFTPSGFFGSSRRADCSARRPPCALRFPSEAHRITPAPSREPEGSARRTMLPSLGFRAPRHMPERRTRCPQGVLPCGVPRPRFGYLHRGVHHRPSGSLAAPERPRAFLFEAFSSRRSDSLSEAHALLPLRASIRLAPIGACGRDRLQGLDPGESSFRPSSPCGRDASMPPWGCSLQSVLPLRPASASWIRARSLTTRWAGLTSRPACVSRSSGAEGSACPSRGRRLSWDSSPFNRRGITESRRGGRAHGFASRLAACTRLESIRALSAATRHRGEPVPDTAVRR